MDHIFRVEINQSFQNLRDVLSTHRFANFAITTIHVLNAATSKIFQIYAEDILIDHFTAKVLHDEFVLESLIPINFFFYCPLFILVQTLKRVHQSDLLHDEHLSRFNINCFVNFASRALTNKLTLLPLNYFSKYLIRTCLSLFLGRVIKEVVLWFQLI